MASKNIQTIIEWETFKELKKEALEREITLAQLLRQIVEGWLNERKSKKEKEHE